MSASLTCLSNTLACLVRPPWRHQARMALRYARPPACPDLAGVAFLFPPQTFGLQQGTARVRYEAAPARKPSKGAILRTATGHGATVQRDSRQRLRASRKGKQRTPSSHNVTYTTETAHEMWSDRNSEAPPKISRPPSGEGKHRTPSSCSVTYTTEDAHQIWSDRMSEAPKISRPPSGSLREGKHRTPSSYNVTYRTETARDVV